MYKAYEVCTTSIQYGNHFVDNMNRRLINSYGTDPSDSVYRGKVADYETAIIDSMKNFKIDGSDSKPRILLEVHCSYSVKDTKRKKSETEYKTKIFDMTSHVGDEKFLHSPSPEMFRKTIEIYGYSCYCVLINHIFGKFGIPNIFDTKNMSSYKDISFPGTTSIRKIDESKSIACTYEAVNLHILYPLTDIDINVWDGEYVK